MTAPNIAALSTITGKSVGVAVGTSATDVVANAASSNKVFKINSLIIANVDGTNNAEVTVVLQKAGSNDFHLAKTVVVPADATLVVIDKNTSLYLEEGDNIEAGAGAASDATITINYEELS